MLTFALEKNERDMKIEILRNENGSLFARNAETFKVYFQFEYRGTEPWEGGPAWYFWIRRNFDPDIFEGEKKDFPTDFFESACKAKAFIYDKVSLTENLEIVAGEKFLR